MRRLAILAAITIASLVTGVQSAYAADAPDLTISEGRAYRNVIETGDLFILVRYELPVSDTDGVSDAWCAQLVDETGCDETPADPTAPTGLISGAAFLTFYADNLATLESQAQLPRIGNALSGIYFSAGHSITWADADTDVCVESSTTLYTNPTDSCIPVSYNSASAGQAEQRDQLIIDLKAVLSNLQDARREPQFTYVNNTNLITTAGRTYALEALGVIDRVIPAAFQTGAGSVITADYTPVVDDSALQQSIDATATASGVTGNLDGVGSHFFGISGAAFATVATVLAGFVVAAVMFAVTKHGVLASLGFMTPLTWGLWVRSPTIALMFTLIFLLATFGGWYLVKRAS